MIRIRQWRFSPGLYPTIGVLFVSPILVSLGFWQLDRAKQKQAYHQSFSTRQAAARIDLNKHREKLQDQQAILWRRVVLDGMFTDIDILLDNQTYRGRAGYHVFTPFRIAGEDKQVLVNRGWVPIMEEGRHIPPRLIRTDSGLTLHAVAKHKPATGIRLKEGPPEQIAAGVYRVAYIDLDQLAKLTGTDLLGYILRLEADSEQGYLRDWPTLRAGDIVHLAYALQWFLFALTLVVLYVVLNMKREAPGS